MEIKKCNCGGVAFMETQVNGDMADTTIRCLKCGFSIGIHDHFTEKTIATTLDVWNRSIEQRAKGE
jgi:hypothetical protein